MELPITKINKNEEDLKTEDDSENFDEINPNLLKIIEKHQDKIITITNIINISEFIGYLSLLVFLLMLAIRLSPNVSFNWLILFTPAATCVISFTIILNAYLKLKDIFEESDNLEEENKNSSSSLGSILSYFCLNSASLCALVYLVLLSLRLQNIIISINYGEIAIPIYVLYGIAVFYYIFILPAFLKNKMIFPLFIFGVYIIASFIFFVLLNMKLDKIMQGGYYSLIFFSMLSAIAFQIVYYGYLLVKAIMVKNNFVIYISIEIALSLLLVALLLTGLKLDSVISIDNWVPLVMIIFSYMILISDKLYAFFEKNGNLNQNEQYLSNYDSEKHF